MWQLSHEIELMSGFSARLVVCVVWQSEHALAFQVGGVNCAYLVTSRQPNIGLDFAGDGLIPVRELAEGKRHLFCEDSIVRGTQLGSTFQRLYQMGTKEIHLRIACPPLLYGCPFLNFSRSSSELELAARKAVQELSGGNGDRDLAPFSEPRTEEYSSMVKHIADSLGVTSLRYQPLDAMIKSIGLPRQNLCTHCWTGPLGAAMAEG